MQLCKLGPLSAWLFDCDHRHEVQSNLMCSWISMAMLMPRCGPGSVAGVNSHSVITPLPSLRDKEIAPSSVQLRSKTRRKNGPLNSLTSRQTCRIIFKPTSFCVPIRTHPLHCSFPNPCNPGMKLQNYGFGFPSNWEERQRKLVTTKFGEGNANSDRGEHECEEVQDEERPPFDLDLAVILAGFAFEAYNTPSVLALTC